MKNTEKKLEIPKLEIIDRTISIGYNPNTGLKEHFILKCKEIVLEVIKMRAQTATSVINGNLNLKQVKQLYEDAVNKINNYETSKEE